MRFGSLFSGIGGMDLGLEWAGLECAWQVENDPYAVRVLEKHWPEVTRYADIREVDFGGVEPVELLAGGFPCQDLSYAGKGLGLSGARSGLWSEFKRAVRAVGPRYVLVENVPGLLSRGMGAVLGDLASLGYDAEWQSLPAAAFGAPHLRWRVFIVGYSPVGGWMDTRAHHREHSAAGRPARCASLAAGLPCQAGGQPGVLADAQCTERRQGQSTRYEPNGADAGWTQETGGARASRSHGGAGTLAHADGGRREGWSRAFGQTGRHEPANGGEGETDVGDTHIRLSQGQRPRGLQILRARYSKGQPQGAGAGAPHFWTVEPDVGRVAHGVPSRVDRLRGLGNAVVPQVAEYIGRCILEANREAS